MLIKNYVFFFFLIIKYFFIYNKIKQIKIFIKILYIYININIFIKNKIKNIKKKKNEKYCKFKIQRINYKRNYLISLSFFQVKTKKGIYSVITFSTHNSPKQTSIII